MTLDEAQAWFKSLSQREKVLALLDVMHDLTVVARDIYADDRLTRERSVQILYRISEMNHRFTSAARSMLQGQETYPDSELMRILLDQSSDPELDGGVSFVVERAVQLAESRQLQIGNNFADQP